MRTVKTFAELIQMLFYLLALGILWGAESWTGRGELS